MDTLLQDVGTQIRDLDTRFRRLEQSLERLNGKTPQVTIENVHIHQPVLEKLEFRLDGLDIEHLSGSLNLGNNFGTKVSEAQKPSGSNSDSKKKAVSSPEQGEPSPSLPGLHKTAAGFRLNNRR
jgi:hypothetical protein